MKKESQQEHPNRLQKSNSAILIWFGKLSKKHKFFTILNLIYLAIFFIFFLSNNLDYVIIVAGLLLYPFVAVITAFISGIILGLYDALMTVK